MALQWFSVPEKASGGAVLARLVQWRASVSRPSGEGAWEEEAVCEAVVGCGLRVRGEVCIASAEGAGRGRDQLEAESAAALVLASLCSPASPAELLCAVR